MKLHWGHGIAIFLLCYVGVLLIALLSSMKMNHNLVAKDYYAQDLGYQSRYEKEVNQIEADNLVINYNHEIGQVSFEFLQAESIDGTIHFYRPSNAELDFSSTISSGLEIVKTQGLQKGKWKIKVDWTMKGKEFYKEQELFL